MSLSPKYCGFWALRRLWCRFFGQKSWKNAYRSRHKTHNRLHLSKNLWGLVVPHRWTRRQIYWEIHNYPFLDHKLLIEKSLRKKIDKMHLDFSHKQLSRSFSWIIQKCEGMSCLVNKSKIVFLAFTKPYLQLVLQLPFSWQKSCIVA